METERRRNKEGEKSDNGLRNCKYTKTSVAVQKTPTGPQLHLSTLDDRQQMYRHRYPITT